MVGSSSSGVSVFFMLMLMMHGVYRSAASGDRFIGIGYNILKGNPEGADINGGLDPGLLTTHPVIDLTYDQGNTEANEVHYSERSGDLETSWKTTYYGTSSYAKKLDHFVEITGEMNTELHSSRFGASTGFNRVKQKTETEESVFFDKTTVRNRGSLRLKTELASADQFRLDRGFVSTACSLPNTWSESEYMTFIDTRGTHVVTYVDVGILEGVKKKEERVSFVTYVSKNYASSVSAGGEYNGYSASLAVDMEKFNSDLGEEDEFGSSETRYTIGSEDLNEPIKITLKSMHEIFEDEFWTRSADYISDGLCSESWQRSVVQGFVLNAIENYSAWKGIPASTDQDVIISLTWPIGVYGLPKPTSGCPGEFDWNEGSRSHDTENTNADNAWSDPLHLAGVRDASGMTNHFCMKTVENTGSGWTWPEGSYCIYKYNDECPDDFEEGWIRWDDQDGNLFNPNRNSKSGILPAGTYDTGSLTTIKFCCREDGTTDKAIYLPTEENFMLLSRFDQCQEVHGMDMAEEWFRWDTEDSSNGDDQSDDYHPYQGVVDGESHIILYFCYYTPTPVPVTMSPYQRALLARWFGQGFGSPWFG